MCAAKRNKPQIIRRLPDRRAHAENTSRCDSLGPTNGRIASFSSRRARIQSVFETCE